MKKIYQIYCSIFGQENVVFTWGFFHTTQNGFPHTLLDITDIEEPADWTTHAASAAPMTKCKANQAL